jgi:hypothetical protein
LADSGYEQVTRELEGRLLDPATRHSPGSLNALLADEFVEFGSSGRVFDKEGTMAALRGEAAVDASIEGFRTAALAEGLALATYRLVERRADAEAPECSLRSSVWRLRDGRWQIVFHQGTPA